MSDDNAAALGNDEALSAIGVVQRALGSACDMLAGLRMLAESPLASGVALEDAEPLIVVADVLTDRAHAVWRDYNGHAIDLFDLEEHLATAQSLMDGLQWMAIGGHSERLTLGKVASQIDVAFQEVRDAVSEVNSRSAAYVLARCGAGTG